jgi:hypothetical protein
MGHCPPGTCFIKGHSACAGYISQMMLARFNQIEAFWAVEKRRCEGGQDARPTIGNPN